MLPLGEANSSCYSTGALEFQIKLSTFAFLIHCFSSNLKSFSPDAISLCNNRRCNYCTISCYFFYTVAPTFLCRQNFLCSSCQIIKFFSLTQFLSFFVFLHLFLSAGRSVSLFLVLFLFFCFAGSTTENPLLLFENPCKCIKVNQSLVKGSLDIERSAEL